MKSPTRVLVSIILMFAVAPAGAADLDEMLTDAVKAFGKTLDEVPEDLRTVAVYKIEADSKDGINVPALQDQLVQIILEKGVTNEITNQ